ncbi:hypothetical protein LF41_2128 [Lysobacter dokdonensis DS-58]|uniref:Uncharacterized protein n=1 Tax=Lysobacter dokdonensis DS-58 TaxID=1300345 RepID=A0A0A2X4P9_9GAMM|nr:hypothetical protein [Lysobacter dokdonensis]KGQ20174.1 hypothetical protein LF41_2128 [Lysobacter dokdonensis DS-58]
MSLQLQLKRGLLALPVAGLLILVGAVAPAGAAAPSEDCVAAAAAKAVAPVERRVDFHSMLPGALHVLRKVQIPVGKG